MSWKEAKAAGLKEYEGTPCRHGHTTRWVSNRNCVVCCSTASHAWQKQGHIRERARVQRIKDRAAIRRDVISHYGGKCACCGESEDAFLCIDHINGGGNQHRKVTFKVKRTESGSMAGTGGGRFYRWLQTNNYPPEFQVLCWNCNSAKHKLGQCPHITGLSSCG